MTENRLLIGSLSNDLNRIANLAYRGNEKAACKFWEESKKWIYDLKNHSNKPYIAKIIADLEQSKFNPRDLAQAEKNLMYSIILQNYALHIV